MSHVIHEIIAVTSYNKNHIRWAWSRADALFPSDGILIRVTPVYQSHVNGYYTFIVLPDGSKEGWEEAEVSAKQRGELIEWLEAQAFADGSSPYAWTLAQYGEIGKER